MKIRSQATSDTLKESSSWLWIEMSSCPRQVAHQGSSSPTISSFVLERAENIPYLLNSGFQKASHGIGKTSESGSLTRLNFPAVTHNFVP